MCGIVGYAGSKQAAPILLDGLSRLEYRGYDSAGLCVFSEGELKLAKSKGRLAVLRTKTENGATLPGYLGIGHTRWATHGEPNDTNSHPHVSQNGKIAVVHNGIIENYLELREFLQQKGVQFASQTDTEVVAQLMEYCMGLPEVETVSDALYMVLHRIEGAYALGILCSDDPDHVYAARKDAPLLIGFGEGENFIASDVTALVSHTKNVVYLDDGELAVADDVDIGLIEFAEAAALGALAAVDLANGIAPEREAELILMQGDVFCQRNGVIEAQCQIGVALLEAVNLLFRLAAALGQQHLGLSLIHI